MWARRRLGYRKPMFVQESPERSRQNGRLSCRDERDRDRDPESVTLRDCLIVSTRPACVRPTRAGACAREGETNETTHSDRSRQRM